MEPVRGKHGSLGLGYGKFDTYPFIVDSLRSDDPTEGWLSLNNLILCIPVELFDRNAL